ncbi:iron chelate uptake ABC transporter family permease subunit [Candidatus Poribacteria bacterium]|nr:iron chelate uptake ABC transporter family permease subunit [Candidatus Poribacteria bacterium]
MALDFLEYYLMVENTWPSLGPRKYVVIGILAALIFFFLLSLAVGSINIPLKDVVKVLIGKMPEKTSWKRIILMLRLPRAVTAVLAGAALAVSGLQMQTLFRNPLAGPFILGINSGASLGVALVVLGVGAVGATSMLSNLGLFGDFGVVIAASIGSGCVLAIVLIVARRVRSAMTLLILGLMFGYATSALVSILLYFSVAERIHSYVNWTFGSFAGVTWTQMRILAPVIILGLLISHLLVKPLNALLLGEEYARSMGLTVKRARFFIIASTAILAGAITAFCGPIGFLGVAVPHLCRSLFATSDHRVLVPTVSIIGAILALIADLVAQMPSHHTVLPLNAITSLIGAPVVTWVILRRRNLSASFAS